LTSKHAFVELSGYVRQWMGAVQTPYVKEYKQG